jgi:hypothetical protein
MTPQNSKTKYDELISKEEKIKITLLPYGDVIEFFDIAGRTLPGMFNISKEIGSKISQNEQTSNWAIN